MFYRCEHHLLYYTFYIIHYHMVYTVNFFSYDKWRSWIEIFYSLFSYMFNYFKRTWKIYCIKLDILTYSTFQLFEINDINGNPNTTSRTNSTQRWYVPTEWRKSCAFKLYNNFLKLRGTSTRKLSYCIFPLDKRTVKLQIWSNSI